DLNTGDLGLAARPERIQDFKDGLELSIQYANALNCKRMHILAGRVFKDISFEERNEYKKTYMDNLKYAADRLSQEGILALIEAVNNKISVPDYFLSCPHEGLEIVKKLNHPNLKFQF
ncbi:hydroxypyruvate isomerase, partial [Biomphalaria glabrata]